MVTDGLGRVTAVFEDANGSNLQTQYTYNAAGSLTKVVKCAVGGCPAGQTRTFTYDALQRLTQAVNPESGTVGYSYTDGNGVNRIALQYRTDARGNTSFYGYDAMDRLTSITYNDGTPNAGYSYDPTNFLIQAKNGNVTNNYSTFDGDGRVTTSSVQMQGQTYSFSYQYDLNGDLIKETYPSGRVMNMTYDIAKRPQTENGMKGGVTTNYVQSAGYFPDGQVQFWQYGSNLWSWQSVDKMLRPWQAWATQNNNGNNWMFYDYYGFDNNSSVISANEGFGTGVPFNSMTFMNDQYEYDGLKRLTKVTDTNYSRQYGWDEYGNLSLKQNAGVPLSGLTPYNNGTNPYNTVNNHLPGTNYGYDARGMMTKIGAVTMAYDAEGNMKDTNDSGTGQNLTWIYDAEGQRAQKLVSGTASVLYVHDAFGQLAAEYNQSGITASCQTCYLTYDMLGTVRLVTNQSQAVVARHDYLPFAEEIFNGTAGRNGNFGAISNVTQGFTGQEADGGTATLDFFNARHMSGVLGTFVQPDPANAGADITRPQSWNAYGYVLGNPLGAVDPSGMNALGDFLRNIGRTALNFGSEFASLFGGCSSMFCINHAEVDPVGTFGSPATGGIAAGSGSGGTNSGGGGSVYNTGAIFRSVSFLSNAAASQPAKNATALDDCTGLPDIGKFKNAAITAINAYPVDEFPIPWLRGIFIHYAFTGIVSKLNNTSVNVAYKDRAVASWFTLGSVRPDAVYGNVTSPSYVLELKTGGARLRNPQLSNYHLNLPPNTRICEAAESVK